MKRQTYIAIMLIGLIAAGTLLTLYWSSTVKRGTTAPTVPFDPAVWSRSAGTSVRWTMLNDLKAHHMSVGMSEQDVRLLLGSPDRILPPTGMGGAKKGDGIYLYYDVSAPDPKQNWDSRYFIVILDEKSRVLRWLVFED